MDKIESIVNQYCKDVISGKRIAGQLEKLSVKRYQDDLKEGYKRGLYLDKKAAKKSIEFFKFLKHSKGEFSGQTFELQPWQMFVNWNLFGWKIRELDGKTGKYKRKNLEKDVRRFTYSYIEVARKNGKSTFAAGNGLYLLIADKEPAAEIYCFATKEEQAKKTIFAEAKNMVTKSPFLSKKLKTYTKSIFSNKTLSFFQPLGSDSDTQDGLNTHGGINDEYHAHKSDSMFNVIKSSMGARRNPHIMTITTAGVTIGGACHTERGTCVKILKGILQQDNKFVLIFTLDEKDDWEDKSVWPKANPSIDVIPTLKKFLLNEYIDAKNNPSRTNNFKTKNLNIWCSSEQDFISDENWMKCDQYPILLEELKGRPCHVGIDLAKRVDLNAMICVFTDKIPNDIFGMFWIPQSKVEESRDEVNYEAWSQQRFVSILGDKNIDMDAEAEEMVNILSHFDVQSIQIDPAYIEFGVGLKLSNAGLELTGFRQGFISMTPPIEALEAGILNKEFNHGGNPVLRWNNSNVALWSDPAGNRKIHKAKSKGRVDGMVALVMAIGGKMEAENQEDINDYYKKKHENDEK